MADLWRALDAQTTQMLTSNEPPQCIKGGVSLGLGIVTFGKEHPINKLELINIWSTLGYNI